MEGDIGDFRSQLGILQAKLARTAWESDIVAPARDDIAPPPAGEWLPFGRKADSHGSAGRAISAPRFRDRGIWLAVAAFSLTVVAVCAFWAVFIYQQMYRLQDAALQRDRLPRDEPRAEPLSSVPAAEHRARPLKTLSPDFALSIGQLDDALGKLQNERPEDVLNRVHDANAAQGIDVCSFEWHNGEPRLLFGKGKDHVEVDSVLGRCADAVGRMAKRARISVIPPARP